jgi:hypothetical protein
MAQRPIANPTFPRPPFVPPPGFRSLFMADWFCDDLPRDCGQAGRGGIVSNIQELQDIIRRLHGSDSEHIASIPVVEKFQGKTIWDGVVEVFDLKQHPTAFRSLRMGA